MTTRRDFFKTTAAFAAGSMLFPMISCSGQKIIGLQLYSLREQIKKDLNGTLDRLAKIGYNSLEAAGYSIKNGTFYGKSPKEFASMVDGMGMPLNSSHTTFELDVAEKVIADAAEAGVKYIVYPYLSDKFRQNIDGYKSTAEKFNKLGEIAKKSGIRFVYHNHAFEFKQMEGQTPYDLLVKETDPSLVAFELDLYWIVRSGNDPIEYFKKFPGRFELFHVKDMTKSDDQFFAPVGTGRIDFARIFAEKETAGLKMIFVEQDRYKTYEPFQSVEMSFNYLKEASFV